MDIDISDPTIQNKEIADKLLSISYYYKLSNEPYRGRAFSDAAIKIAHHPLAILSGPQAILEIKGVGESIGTVIDEYLTTGRIKRLEDLEAKFMERKSVIDLFTSFYGIGTITAQKFYDAGYRTMEDLWSKAPLNDAQKKGIMWHEHIEQKIPRSEMDEINTKIGSLLDPYGIIWTIAGSYRRQEISSNDVDVLIQSRSDLNMEGVQYILHDILPDIGVLAMGPTKFMGIIRLSEEHVGHRIDIRLIDPESYPFALLYFTGSQRFNILMRHKANSMGMTLNEYGLFFTGTNDMVPGIITEEDIFKVLKMSYLEPKLRTRDMKQI